MILRARGFVAGAALTLSASCAGQEPPPPPLTGFAALADAYRVRHSQAAADAYTEQARVIYAYNGAPLEQHDGRAAIAASFAGFFGGIDPGQPLDLNFRIAERSGENANGFYRLRVGSELASYGRFDVALDGSGKFVSDRSSSATRADFESTAGPVLVRPEDEELDRGYYGLLAGRYRLPEGCELVVTRSVVRLFLRNSCDQSWRGLSRVSGLDWTAGGRVLASEVTASYRFASVGDAPSASLTATRTGTDTVAQRVVRYTVQEVSFTSADGTKLAGALYVPSGSPRRRPASVLIHGSGPQDRDGYASIVAVLADALAAEGRVVLAYDKRGSGGSTGDGDGAGFATLAADAMAAMRFLRGRADVDPARIGLAGSSQAGWVAAQAIADGAAPADVLLLGAAGAAFTVREQNLYNTDVRMACSGIAEPRRRVALDQQAAFFDALADRSKSARLDALTRAAAGDAGLADWLFPDSAGLETRDAWYTVLDPAFDPLPVWRGYRGRAVFLFSEFDDSTDSAGAIVRLRGSRAEVRMLPGAQHLGLDASSRCDGELAERSRFSPALFEAIGEFARAE